MTDVRKARTILQRASSFLLLLLVLCSCDGTLFHSFRSVDGGWQRGNQLEYIYDGGYMDSSACGFYVEARTTANYLYKNLVVRAEFLNMRDSLLSVDTIPLVIYNDNGRRTGATAGMLYQQKSEFGVLKLPVDTLVIRLSHIMPDDTLEGVADVGVRLTTLR